MIPSKFGSGAARRARIARRWADRGRARRASPLLMGALALMLCAWHLEAGEALQGAGLDENGETGIIDLHVHAAGIGARGSGAFISEEMQENFRFPIYLRAFGVSREELQEKGDVVLLEKINASIAQSARISKAVILAMDGVVDDSGSLDREATQLYVPNDFLARELPRFEHLLFGASVNPLRSDALERLKKAKSEGAVLVKWIPNIMHLDPADERIRDFYLAMVELELPLLTHTGRERAFANARDDLGDPMRLVLPLELGVTVIAAHIATDGETEGEDNFLRILPLFERYPNLFADISSLTQINKLGHMTRALETPGLVSRLVYGSDWPLQFFPLVSPYFHVNRIGLARADEIAKIENQWDEDVALKEALGVPRVVFARTEKVLGIGKERGTDSAP